jgi:hypothetical protein
MEKSNRGVSVGDVLSSKVHQCRVSVHEVLDNAVVCDWFDDNDHLHRERIPIDDLESIPALSESV